MDIIFSRQSYCEKIKKRDNQPNDYRVTSCIGLQHCTNIFTSVHYHRLSFLLQERQLNRAGRVLWPFS